MADKPLEIDAATFDAATAEGRRLLSRGPLATAAKFDAGRIHVELNNGCAFAFPVEYARGLAGATEPDLRRIDVVAAGLGLYWPALDVDLYVPNVVKGILGTKAWMAQIGAAGGKVTTAAKQAAARANGKLGGRPRRAETGK